MLALDYRPSKRLHAALKLAAMYAAGVTLLVVGLVASVDPPKRVLELLAVFGIPAAICFSVAFLLLAVARRAGFTALWVVVFGFWIWATTQAQDSEPFAANIAFVTWSVLAAPLYVMCALGFSRAASRWRQRISIAVWPIWAALAVVAVRQLQLLRDYDYDGFVRGQNVGWLGQMLHLALLVTPPAVTLAGLLKVYSRARTDPVQIIVGRARRA